MRSYTYSCLIGEGDYVAKLLRVDLEAQRIKNGYGACQVSVRCCPESGHLATASLKSTLICANHVQMHSYCDELKNLFFARILLSGLPAPRSDPAAAVPRRISNLRFEIVHQDLMAILQRAAPRQLHYLMRGITAASRIPASSSHASVISI
jgi:hypothetical protein